MRLLSTRSTCALGWVWFIAIAASAAPASANGVTHHYNLLWDDCSLGPYATSHFDACTTDGPPPLTMVMTVLPATVLDGIIGAQGAIEVVFEGTTVPDWWRLDDGGCRQGRLSTDTLIGIANPPYSCPSVWGGDVLSFPPSFQPGPEANRGLIFWVVAAQQTATIDPAEASEFYVVAFKILRDGMTTCAGCDVPASIAAVEDPRYGGTVPPSHLWLVRPATDPRGDVYVTQPLVTPFIYWQGMPTAAPHRTWGELKSLYR